MKAKKDDLFEEEDDPKKGDSFTEEDYLDDDYVDDDDLYDYERLDHSPSPAKEENISVSVNPEAADDLEEESEEKEETAKAAETASWAVSENRFPASFNTFLVADAISFAAILNSSLLEFKEI